MRRAWRATSWSRSSTTKSSRPFPWSRNTRRAPGASCGRRLETATVCSFSSLSVSSRSGLATVLCRTTSLVCSRPLASPTPRRSWRSTDISLLCSSSLVWVFASSSTSLVAGRCSSLHVWACSSRSSSRPLALHSTPRPSLMALEKL